MSDSSPLFSVAIVGCGVIGRTHVDAVLALADVRIEALIDVSEERSTVLADSVAERTGTRPPTYATIADFAASGTVAQLIVIATPSGLHVDQAIAALETGAHVLIEKPLDVNLARARRLAEAAEIARGRGQVCSVVSQHRFDPDSSIVHAQIAAGRLGRLTSAVATVPWWRSQRYYDSGDWRGTWALDGGGALMNQGVHTLDLLLWFLGRPVTVSAEIALLAHDDVEVEDTVVATIRFESGALAVVHATTAGYPGLAVRLTVLGARGSVVIEGDNLVYIHVASGDGVADMGMQGRGNQLDSFVDRGEASAAVDATEFALGHQRQYEDLLAAIRDGRQPLVTVDDAILALATVRSVYVSAILGRSVEVHEVLAGEYDDIPLELPGRESASV